MSNKLQHTETKALKQIFDMAKIAPRDKDGDFENFEFNNEVDMALFEIGKKRLYELKEEVYPYLKDACIRLRIQAIRTLGYDCGDGLNLPEFKDMAYEIWLNDPDNGVKEAAINEWVTYHVGSKDPIILKYLYNIVYSERYTIHARIVALLGIMEVANAVESAKEVHNVFDLERLAGDISKVSGLEDDYDEKINRINMDNIKMFNAAINKGHYYNKINSIMKKYVPNWGK